MFYNLSHCRLIDSQYAPANLAPELIVYDRFVSQIWVKAGQ